MDVLNEPIIVTTMIGDSVVAKRVYKNFPIIFPNRVTHVEFVELDMVKFYLILGWIGCMTLFLPLILEQEFFSSIFLMNHC